MYQVYFWESSKKTNSTYAPIKETAPLVLDCDIMDGSGLLAPTLIINEDRPIKYNYCYIHQFRRYYFINNWHYNLGLWSCDTQIDVLASWRTNILAQNLYITRSATSYNMSLTDTAYPMMAERPTSHVVKIPNLFNVDYADGYFITGIVNTDTNTIGAISYYAFTASQFRTLLGALMGDVSFYGVSDISSELTKLLANPFQYIVSCRWLPVLPSGSVSITGQLSIGWWKYTVTGYRLPANSIYQTTYTIAIPTHPQIYRGDYLGRTPYSEYYLVFAPFGSFSLPPEKIFGAGRLVFNVSVDCITGLGVLEIWTEDGGFVSRVEGTIGANIALAQLAPNVDAILSSPTFTDAKSAINTELASVNILGIDFSETVDSMMKPISNIKTAITDVATGIANAYISNFCPPQFSGNNEGVNGGRFDIALYGWFTSIADETLYEKGRPLCAVDTIANHQGFIQCGECDITIPCTKPESDAIKNYLISGIFVE